MSRRNLQPKSARVAELLARAVLVALLVGAVLSMLAYAIAREGKIWGAW